MARPAQRMPRYLIAALAAAGLGALWLGWWATRRDAAGAQTQTVHVSAAISLREPLTEIARSFERENPGVRIALNFGGTNFMVRQVLEGAPCDVFLSADRENMQRLIAAGAVEQEGQSNSERAAAPAGGAESGAAHHPGVVDLLRNELVVIARADDSLEVHSPADLARPEVGMIAACDEAVPIGAYTRAYLRRQGLERLLESSPRFDNVAASCAAVASGQLRIGFAYRSDVRTDGPLGIAFNPPPEDQPQIVYPIARIASRGGQGAQQTSTAQARAFFNFLRSPPARSIFERHGFIWADGP